VTEGVTEGGPSQPCRAIAGGHQGVRWIVAVVLGVACAVIVDGALCVDHFMSAFAESRTVVRSSIPSPDGKKSVVIFWKECRATVGFNTQASIAPLGMSYPSL
jgi:hypothetical protein